MSLKYRTSWVLVGLGFAIIGALMVYRRVPPYTNYLCQNFFPVSFIATGLVIAVAAFLPPKKWTYRHITTKLKNTKNSA